MLTPERECVEAATIVLAVGMVRGWRSALVGTGLGLSSLIALIVVLGPAPAHVPESLLQLAVGQLLLLFGMRWLRKSVLRGAGVIPLHVENAVFDSETTGLQLTRQSEQRGIDAVAVATAFKAVLEGIEVAFVVLAVCAGGPGLMPAALVGALAAAVLVTLGAFAVRRPLARVPENTLKFAVGVIITAFGIYWSGEGFGLPWPGGDLAVPVIALALLVTALLGVRLTSHQTRAMTGGTL